MPLDEILVIARQISEALEAAHDKGIIHRVGEAIASPITVILNWKPQH